MATLTKLVTRINLEMSGDTKLYMVSAKQGDKATRRVIAKLLNDGAEYTIPTSARAVVNVKKPDGKRVYNSCTFSGCEVTIELTNQMLAASGTAYCDVEIRTADDKEVITSASFTIEIEESMRSDKAIMSANEFTEIENRIAKNVDPAVEKATKAADAAEKATAECIEVTEQAENALQNQEELEATLNTAVKLRQEVSQMTDAVRAAQEQVEQDKQEIDDTIQNSLLASASEILASVKSYFERAEALYSSMYLDCDGETPYLRTVTPIFIDGATPQVRNVNEGVDFDGGTPTSRLLAV